MSEPGSERFVERMGSVQNLKISAGNLLELHLVLQRKDRPEATKKMEAVLAAANVDVIPVSEAQVALGREAHRRYGKGSGHPAKLNFGDCFAYALAAETGEPLLCTGEDFGLTDVRLA